MAGDTRVARRAGKAVALTLAREPHPCGGLLASGELFRDAAEVLFRELLHAEPP